ncbi:MAG: hypothetical protein ACYDAK_13700 [Candidatus Limnocylindrales bacterium]
MAAKSHNGLILGGVAVVALLVYEYFNGSSSGNATTPNTAGVATGAVLNYSAQINTSFFTSLADALDAIATTLQPLGINVTNSQNNGSILGTLESALTLTGQTTGVTLQIQVNNSGYARATDLQSVIDNAVYQATGSLPLSSSIAFAAGTQPTPQGASSTNLQTGGLTGFFASFGTGAATGILLALAGIVGLVVVFPEVAAFGAAKAASR